MRRISNSPTNPIAEGSDELDDEVEVVPKSIGHQSSASRIFRIQVIPSTPRAFQPVISTILSSIPPPSISPSTTRPHLVSPQLQPVASSSIRREYQLRLPFTAAQVFQQRKGWPIQVTTEDPNMANNGQEAGARLFRRVYRNSREVITYANDSMIPGTASEEMAAKFEWYED
ncbi:hypothetical protein O181_031671 [Austropuccinia psidii MF-1]|uniref:Uncharacterized protein n=1 Tax=Austropuccinia psidii MF-1 TaxID=1389203 RepID=A0A9Q3CVB4_9BASI|nr:hypothetical protein [Austropuccinia psidii MF-1]